MRLHLELLVLVYGSLDVVDERSELGQVVLVGCSYIVCAGSGGGMNCNQGAKYTRM